VRCSGRDRIIKPNDWEVFMNGESGVTAKMEAVALRGAAGVTRGRRACLTLAFAACLGLLSACATTGTLVDQVWRDSVRGEAVLGKTLVVAVFTDADVAIPLENEWVRQLRDSGVDASAANTSLRGVYPPDEQRVVELVKTGGFDTLLVSRLVAVKQVEREVPAYQVAVVETRLYDAATERQFWSARSDTYLVSHRGDGVQEPRSERIRGFVETIIEAMSESKVF